MSMKKRAFTLGEVLITLAVVGLVALLTVPSLVADIAGKQRMVKLQNTIGDLENATKLYMMKRRVNTISYASDFRALLKETLKVENTTSVPMSSYKLMNGNALTGFTTHSWQYNLENGVSLRMFGTSLSGVGFALGFYIDVNGAEPPNVSGLDLFQVYIFFNPVYDASGEILRRTGDISIMPNISNYTDAQLLSRCKTNGSDGIQCCYALAERHAFNPEYYKEE